MMDEWTKDPFRAWINLLLQEVANFLYFKKRPAGFPFVIFGMPALAVRSGGRMLVRDEVGDVLVAGARLCQLARHTHDLQTELEIFHALKQELMYERQSPPSRPRQ